MKKTNITKTIILIAILALMQIATFAQKAELVIETGHTKAIDSIAFSPDGKIIASGSVDNTTKLWDVQTGQELRTLSGFGSLVFSPDGKIIALRGNDNSIKLWDMQSGQEFRTIKGDNEIFPIAFSLDGEILITCESNINSIEFWNWKTGEKLRNLKIDSKNNCSTLISNIKISPDGRILAFGCTKEISNNDSDVNNTIILLNLQTGQELRTLVGHTGLVDCIVFSPDGKLLASAGSRDSMVKLWDVQTGRELQSFSQDIAYVNSIAFSPSGKVLASTSIDQRLRTKINFIKTVKLWDVQTGQELRTIVGQTGRISPVSFSPDGKLIASSGSGDATIKLWDVQSGEELRTLAGHSTYSTQMFSPDGKFLISYGTGNIKLWDMQSGKQVQTLEDSTHTRTADFSPDGTLLASAGYEDRMIRLWNVQNGQFLRSFSGFDSEVRRINFSPDGNILASCDGKTIKLWNLQNNQELHTFVNQKGSITSIRFSPDSKTILSFSNGRSIKLYDLQNGRELFSVENLNLIHSFAFSPNGKILAIGADDIKLLNTQTGQIINTLIGQEKEIYPLEFSPNNNILASESDEQIKFWDVESGKIIKTLFKNDPKSINEVFAVVPDFYKRYEPISPNGKFQIRKSENDKSNFYEVKSGKLLASLIALDENDWVVIDPDGRFDASPGAQKLMHFVVGLEPVDLEQIKDRYYTPNLLQRIFKGENLDATRKVSVFTADELYPLAEFSPLRDGQTKVDVKLTNRGGGIGRVQVFVNGAEFLADARPKGFDPKSKSGEFTIDFSAAKTLKKGEANDIKIIARNEAGWLRNRGTEIVYLDDRKKDDAPPEFYAVIGGVSEYENNAFNLRYSAKDARDFARATELGAIKLFGRDHVHIRLLATGTETEKADLTGADSKVFAPTKENFKQTFAEFHKAKPTDVFVVYLAGHGTSINKGGDTGDTYLYLTQEAVTTDKSRLLDDKLRSATTVSSEELAEWIRDVPALKRAMILDTCAAGAVEASLTKARDLSPDQIKALDRMKDRTGFYVLMGSAADAQSYEATRYGQGLLTYSLLQGMSGAKLRDGEYADVSTLFNYAEDTVVEMAKGIGGIQQPRIIAPTESRSFDIGRFSTVEKGKFTLAKVKPLILQPQLSNDKLKFDNLKLSQMVAKALRDESSTIVRGDAEAKLVFVEAEEMNDAVTPGGVYEITGDRIKVTLILVRNNEPVKTVTVEGGAADKEELSRKIVAAIIANAPN